MKWLKDHAVNVEKAARMSDEEVKGKFRIGVLADRDIPDYQSEYEHVRQRARKSDAYRLDPQEVSKMLESNQCY